MEFDALLEQRRSVQGPLPGTAGRQGADRTDDRGGHSGADLEKFADRTVSCRHVAAAAGSAERAGAGPLGMSENTHDAPVLIVTTFVKDRSGFEKNGQPSNELGDGWGCYDLGLQNMNLLLKAEELGLSTLVMGIRDAEAIRRLLGIDEAETIVSVISVGYRDIDPQKPLRKSVDDVASFY